MRFTLEALGYFIMLFTTLFTTWTLETHLSARLKDVQHVRRELDARFDNDHVTLETSRRRSKALYYTASLGCTRLFTTRRLFTTLEGSLLLSLLLRLGTAPQRTPQRR